MTVNDDSTLAVILHNIGSAEYDAHGGPVIELVPTDPSAPPLSITPKIAISIGKAAERLLQSERSFIEHQALPVAGYKPTQSGSDIDLVNEGKELEERVLRYIEKVGQTISGRKPGETGVLPLGSVDPLGVKFLACGRHDIQIGFMQIVRAIFNPGRAKLPEDAQIDSATTGDFK